MTARIIAVSGPPGTGKSTLVHGLAREMDGSVVAYDDFEIITSWPPEKVVAWLDAGAPLEAAIAPRLRSTLQAQSGLVFFEAPFGRACPDTGDLIDTALWLECPNDVALARKIGALASYNLDNKGFSEMVIGWLAAYEGFTRRALQVQREKVMPTADFALSALDNPGKLLSRAKILLNQAK